MSQQLTQGQQVQPLPAAQGAAPGGQAAGVGSSGPGFGGLFSTPTDAPGEPITAGALTGPGPGPSAYFQDDPDELLRAVYTRFPNDDLRSLLEGRGLV